MLLDPTKTVRELAVAFPSATRVFEKTKIDYCCGGDQLLGDACAKAGVDMKVLEQMLETSVEPAPATTVDFQQLTLAELINYILDKHHVYTKDEMNRLEGLVARVVSAHGANHPELLSMRDLLQQLIAELRGHMFKEEQILFPFVVQMEQSVLQNRPAPFAPFGTVYKTPADACISYQTFYQALEAFEQDLHQHIHLENNILFPKAIALEESF